MAEDLLMAEESGAPVVCDRSSYRVIEFKRLLTVISSFSRHPRLRTCLSTDSPERVWVIQMRMNLSKYLFLWSSIMMRYRCRKIHLKVCFTRSLTC